MSTRLYHMHSSGLRIMGLRHNSEPLQTLLLFLPSNYQMLDTIRVLSLYPQPSSEKTLLIVPYILLQYQVSELISE